MTLISSIQNKLRENDVDAILITNALNRRYVSGFTGSAGIVIITTTDAIFMTDFRYENQAYEQVKGFEIITYKQSDAMYNNVIRKIDQLNIDRLAIESDDLNYEKFIMLSEKVNATLVPISAFLSEFRAIKTPEEIAKLKKAAEITEKAFVEICEFIRPGLSEFEVANQLNFILRREGGDMDGRQMTVASGYRSALPHGRPSNKIIQDNEMIILDFGALYQGYHSDITRTIAIGNPPEELKKIHGIVLEALTYSKENIKVGMSGKEVDALARDYIHEKGYGEYFGHGGGHGLGLAIHENPFFSSTSDHILQENMVITIEPGIYITDLGGVRIEDNLIIKKDTAHENITNSPRNLVFF
ncbi:Xaa-Pro peptidase family protein [Bacillus sp. JJ1773]|uniref:M24 family metallopeptidase n=1 Tax=Bacillus sp. JJ1773 TaxID=3122965 RepID=UPI002FFF49F5